MNTKNTFFCLKWIWVTKIKPGLDRTTLPPNLWSENFVSIPKSKIYAKTMEWNYHTFFFRNLEDWIIFQALNKTLHGIYIDNVFNNVGTRIKELHLIVNSFIKNLEAEDIVFTVGWVFICTGLLVNPSYPFPHDFNERT